MACTINAAEIERVKGLGFLNNKGTDLFTARLITVHGKLPADHPCAKYQNFHTFSCLPPYMSDDQWHPFPSRSSRIHFLCRWA